MRESTYGTAGAAGFRRTAKGRSAFGTSIGMLVRHVDGDLVYYFRFRIVRLVQRSSEEVCRSSRLVLINAGGFTTVG